MNCLYQLLNGEFVKLFISKYKFLDHGVLLVTFEDETMTTTFIPYENLNMIKFSGIKKEDKSDDAVQVQA